MVDPEGSRKLTAILAADVAGYSRLMQVDDRATVATLEAYRGVFREHIEAPRAGSWTWRAIAYSPYSTVRPKRCARVRYPVGAAERNEALLRSAACFRIVNLGEVISKADGTVYGDG
jgi:adenylate cyclase